MGSSRIDVRGDGEPRPCPRSKNFNYRNSSFQTSFELVKKPEPSPHQELINIKTNEKPVDVQIRKPKFRKVYTQSKKKGSKRQKSTSTVSTQKTSERIKEKREQDLFDEHTAIHVHITNEGKVASKNPMFNSGGIATVSRYCDPESRNVFRFQLRTFTRNLSIGVKTGSPPLMSFLNLHSGIFGIKPATQYLTEEIEQNELIEMIIEKGALSFVIRGKNLGIAMKSNTLL